jgi:putative ABC transport system permease protein
MRIKYSLKTAIRGLGANRTRSVLTILGIVIGITAIILIMSLGQGAQNLILSQIQGLGSKTIVVLPGRQPKGPSDTAQMFIDSLKERDLEAVSKKINVPTAGKIMPMVYGASTAFYGDQTYRLTILGGSELMDKIFDMSPAKGNFISAEDVKGLNGVVVLGSKVKDELFGNSDAINKRIKIKGMSLRVVGVLPSKGQVSFFNFDEMAIVPYTTAMQYIFGKKSYDRIVVEADTTGNINRTVSDITATIRNSHNITDPDKDDFHIETQADLADRLGTITDVLTLFLIAVAAISLIVGGVGIMNIMLVSVTERTKEIGLRKAVGATSKDILIQFLFEAVALTGLGGIVGIILGTAFSVFSSFVINKFTSLSWSFSFPWLAAGIGIIVSASIGLIFGIYPARQAASKSPIEALRYE